MEAAVGVEALTIVSRVQADLLHLCVEHVVLVVTDLWGNQE